MTLSVDVSKPIDIKVLDEYFLKDSYVEGYKYTDADKKLYEQIKEEIDGDSAPNASRWYNHIKNILSDPALKSYYTQNSSSEDNEDDEDDDLFGEDDEEEVEKMKQERAKEAEAKKKGSSSGNGEVVVRKSILVLDVKPWDDTTDMNLMTENVKAIKMDGLVWGSSDLKPLGYGIYKLRIACVLEDEKVGVDDLTEEIEGLSELVQSVDVFSFNKL